MMRITSFLLANAPRYITQRNNESGQRKVGFKS